MSQIHTQKLRNRMAGVGMLEILIALVVVAIGVLGLAQLQAVAMRQNNNAYLRSQATILAYSIADRMRSNPQEAQNGAYDITFGDETSSEGGQAGQDVDTWLNTLSAVLPSGDGAITTANFPEATISVRYATVLYDYEETESSDTNTVTISVQTTLFDPN